MTRSGCHMKTALITGSTSGIGLAIADALSAAGWRIALHGLGTADEIAKAVDQVAASATHAGLWSQVSIGMIFDR
ncbi:NAD(P)-dependent dehydrogenase (short-subunit alcohol dehydrogenase family) [Burkholderia sp. PvR073]|nr:SDR family NAD(P)-dependent oxidoreductase [Burkholderia sp. lyk4-R2A-23]